MDGVVTAEHEMAQPEATISSSPLSPLTQLSSLSCLSQAQAVEAVEAVETEPIHKMSGDGPELIELQASVERPCDFEWPLMVPSEAGV